MKVAVNSQSLVKNTLIAAVAILGLSAAKVGKSSGKSGATGSQLKDEQIWFSGTVDQAIAEAKAKKKPLLIYWGAVWCPPCNELKSQVFSQPRFAELMQNIVAAHVDGDSQDAQLWSDKFKASGYPTVLLFDLKGREVMRLAESLDMEEFENALNSALTSGGTISDALAAGLSGKASREQWQMLATYQWGNGGDLPYTQLQLADLLNRLAKSAPEKYLPERAMLGAGALSLAATNGDPSGPEETKTLEEIHAAVPKILPLLLANYETIWAVRSTITGGAEPIFTWAFATSSAKVDELTAAWIAAARQIALDPRASVSTRVSAVYPELTLEKLRLPKGNKLSEKTVALVHEKAREADLSAKTAYDRHAAMTDVAGMLAEVGDLNAARQILEKEIEKTDTPWYFQSALAGIYKEAGKSAEALAWSEKARLSVKGRASRLQWISADLVLIAKTPDKNQKAKLLAASKDYYETVYSLTDGFLGRNAARAKRVAGALKDWIAKDADLQTLIETYSSKCAKAETASPGCTAHFLAIKGGAA
jgi:protein disulfide-isomerase